MINNYIKEGAVRNDRLIIDLINNSFDYWNETQDLELFSEYLKNNFFKIFVTSDKKYLNVFGVKLKYIKAGMHELIWNNVFFNLLKHILGAYHSPYDDFIEFPSLEKPKDLLIKSLKNYNVIDIGCNQGSSLIASKLGGAKNICGFEIHPQTYTIACDNLKLNKMDDIILLNVGISSCQKSEVYGLGKWAKRRLYELQPSSHNIGNCEADLNIVLSLVTLDEIILNNKYIDFNENTFLTIDCNTYELEALEGAKELIYRTSPFITSKCYGVSDALKYYKLLKSVNNKYKMKKHGETAYFYI